MTTVSVWLPDQPVIDLDGRVAAMITDLLAHREDIETMLIGSVTHHVGRASVQIEIKLLDERVEASPDPSVTST